MHTVGDFNAILSRSQWWFRADSHIDTQVDLPVRYQSLQGHVHTGAHLGVLHLGYDLQVPLGGLCKVPLLCVVSVDARPVLRASVTALPILRAGVYLPPEHLEELLVCD